MQLISYHQFNFSCCLNEKYYMYYNKNYNIRYLQSSFQESIAYMWPDKKYAYGHAYTDFLI